jgi:hypothetical protein
MGDGVPHLHTLVVPRYHDDPAPGRPIPWDSLFGRLPSDEDPRGSAARLGAALPWVP